MDREQAATRSIPQRCRWWCSFSSSALPFASRARCFNLPRGFLIAAGCVPPRVRPGPLVPILWRSMAAALLIAITAEIAGSLGPVPPKFSTSFLPNNYELRENLLPLCGLLMVIGLLVGMQPPAPLSRRPVHSAWFGVGLAATLGIAVIASYMTIWHLIIVALESISNAMQAVADVHHHLSRERVSLAARIDGASGPAALAVAATLATAEWVARDLRRASSITRDQSLTRFGRLYRFATFMAMVLAAAHLVRTTIPHIHKWLSGVWLVIGAGEVAWVLAALATLAAGIVARAIGRSASVVERAPSRVSRWSSANWCELAPADVDLRSHRQDREGQGHRFRLSADRQ